MPGLLALATEMKARGLWVANRPAAVVGEQRGHRLALSDRNDRIVLRRGRWRTLNWVHNAHDLAFFDRFV